MADDTIDVTVQWETSHEMPIPEGMSKDQAVAEFNAGNHDLFPDYTSATASVTGWHANEGQ